MVQVKKSLSKIVSIEFFKCWMTSKKHKSLAFAPLNLKLEMNKTSKSQVLSTGNTFLNYIADNY